MRYEDYNSLLVDNSGSLSYIADMETYELLHLTKAMMEAYGLTDPDEYKGKKCYEFLKGFDKPCLFCTNEFLEEGNPYQWEYYNEALGMWFDLLDTKIMLDGRPCRMEVARDITVRKSQIDFLEDQLTLDTILMECLNILAAEEDLDSAMNTFLATVGGYYHADRAYVFEFDLEKRTLNNTFEWCQEGVTAEMEHLQKIPLEVISDWITMFENTGGFFITNLNEEIPHDTEEYRILEMQGINSLMASPLTVGGTIIGFLGVDDPRKNLGNLSLMKATSDFMLAEIEKRRLTAELSDALEKANIANRSKTKFLFNMAHDIRTPMNSILGFSTMAEKYIDDRERVLNSLEKLNAAGKYLQRFVNNALDMSRIEFGKMTFDLRPYHIPTLLQNTYERAAAEMQKKGIEFTASWEMEDEVAFLDRYYMEKVEWNLISNAFKYTPEGGKVTYIVKQINRPQEGYATYQGIVRDTGIGMSKEFSDRVFEAFERRSVSAVDGIRSTGLGLAITKALLAQMDGDIVCRSKEGTGTEFIFTVTLKTGTMDDLPAKVEDMAARSDFVGKRLLLVEDDEMSREIASDILEEMGFILEMAEDGAMAVEMVEKSEPGYYDLILMDIQMPRMDGYQATRQIRSFNDRELANIPIVAMTANVFVEDRQKAIEAGMNEYVAKPVDVPELISILQQML